MKYRVVTPLARIGQAFAVGDVIEIADKAEAQRMIAADIVAPLKGNREIQVETADLSLERDATRKPVWVEKTATAAKSRGKKG